MTALYFVSTSVHTLIYPVISKKSDQNFGHFSGEAARAVTPTALVWFRQRLLKSLPPVIRS